MPAAYDTVRALALRFPKVVEGMSYGTPSLHVGPRLLGRLQEDGETLVLKIDPAHRARLLAGEPDTFYLTDHYRDHPVMLVNLLAVRESALPALVEGAWRFVAPKRLLAAYDQARRPSSDRPTTGRTSPSPARRSATTRSKAR